LKSYLATSTLRNIIKHDMIYSKKNLQTNLLYTSINLKYDESFSCFLSKKKFFCSLAWAIIHKKITTISFLCTKRKKETKQIKKQAYFVFWRAHITTFSNYNLYNMTLLILAQFFSSMLNAKKIIYIYKIHKKWWMSKKKSQSIFFSSLLWLCELHKYFLYAI
jgi:hypothetical protein